MRKKKLTKRKACSAFIAAIIILILVNIVLLTGERRADIEDMNRMELHYDANSYLILVCADDYLCGIYDGKTPIRSLWCKYLDTANVPKVYALEDLRDVTTLTEWDLNGIEEIVPDGTPVLVYRKES